MKKKDKDKFEEWWEGKKDYFYMNVTKDEAKLIWDSCLETMAKNNERQS